MNNNPSSAIWAGVYTGIGLFDPYHKPNEGRARIVGLLRVTGSHPTWGAVWSFTIANADDASDLLAAGLLRGTINPVSETMSLEYLERIGTAASPHSSSGGRNHYCLEEIQCNHGQVVATPCKPKALFASLNVTYITLEHAFEAQNEQHLVKRSLVFSV